MEYGKKVGINALFFIATLIVNFLGGSGYINGTTQSEVSNEYFTLITPSGTTFSIWGLIYGLVALSLIVMYWKRNEDYYQAAIDRITPLFIVSSILNMAWIVLFSFVQVALSTLVIFIYVIVLALICMRLLDIHDGDHFLLPLTFGLYTGWLMIATVVNVATTLVKSGWEGFGIADNAWAFIILIIAALLVMFVTYRTGNAVLPLPVAWAYYGIYQNLMNAHDGNFRLLEITAIVGMVVLIGMTAIQFYRNRYGVLPREPYTDIRVRRDP